MQIVLISLEWIRRNSVLKCVSQLEIAKTSIFGVQGRPSHFEPCLGIIFNQLNLLSLQSMCIEYQPAWLGLRWGAFTGVGSRVAGSTVSV